MVRVMLLENELFNFCFLIVCFFLSIGLFRNYGKIREKRLRREKMLDNYLTFFKVLKE
jgi:hypothetical protein